MKKSLRWIALAGILLVGFGTIAILAPVSGSPVACVTPPTNLVSWWQAEEDAFDAVGNNHGTFYSGAYTAGRVSQAFMFDGSQSYVSVSDASNLDGQSALTLEAWIRPDSLGWPNPDPSSDYEATVISKYDSTQDNRRSYVFGLTDGYLKLSLFGNTNMQRAIANTPITIGSWSHIAGVWDGNTVELYVNGSPITSTLTGSAPTQVSDSTTPLNIGRVESYSGTYTGPAAYFDGLVDELSLYNRALTPAEIAAIFAAGSDGKCHEEATSTPTATGSSSPTPTTIATGTPSPYDYLPFITLADPPTPTPTPTATTAAPAISNGNFEQGHTAWREYSAHGYYIILHESDLPINARNGSWATWFGGEYDEASIIEQDVVVPTNRTILTYWLWIASQDICNPDYDIAGVLIDDEAVDAYLLCSDNNTNGWIGRSVDLSAYAGQQILLTFAAFTDGTLNSNLFIDDIGLQASPLQPLLPAPHESSTTADSFKRALLTDRRLSAFASTAYREQLQDFLQRE